MKTPSPVISCPLCSTHFSHSCKIDNNEAPIFGYGLDFRLLPRDTCGSSDIITCPSCMYTCRVQDYTKRAPGHVKEMVKAQDYLNIFKGAYEDPTARSWIALVNILDCRRINPRDIAIVSLKGSWVAREIGCLKTEKELLSYADLYLEESLRRGLTKSDPGMSIYLLGEINRRRGEFLRARETLTFLGNNPRFRYPALLLTVLVEEEDSTPYWALHAPDQMEKHSARFKGLFPALRSIPPKKTEFSPDELSNKNIEPGEDETRRF